MLSGKPMSRTTDPPSRRHLLDVDFRQLEEIIEALGAKRFRTKQLLEWVYRQGVVTFDEMTSLPEDLRKRLLEGFALYTSRIARRSVSRDGTVKLLLQWPDEATSECVMIPQGQRRTVCVSSQVGCPVGCRFCASGLGGLQRNLTAGEIIEQVLRAGVDASATGGRVNNVVFMGLGEPLANYEAVIRAVRTMNAPWGLGIGARRITLSTVGLPKQICRLADEGLQLNLALSLHAPTDGLREELIPWAQKVRLAELAEACKYYFATTGREITLEYVLLEGKNDRRTHAVQLARFAGQFRCNLNLIRYNPVDGLPYGRPSSEAAHAFQRHLREHGVNAHVRTSRGLDIDAACGQLRRANMRSAAGGAGGPQLRP
jgi:23S rRNA (adenine2503-C2)-methyltransferase